MANHLSMIKSDNDDAAHHIEVVIHGTVFYIVLRLSALSAHKLNVSLSYTAFQRAYVITVRVTLCRAVITMICVFVAYSIFFYGDSRDSNAMSFSVFVGTVYDVHGTVPYKSDALLSRP